MNITGMVQGVLFRHSAKAQAEMLGLSGCAKNMDNGSVEIVAEGKRDNLEKLLQWAREGLRHAKVESIDYTWGEPTGTFSEFRIL